MWQQGIIHDGEKAMALVSKRRMAIQIDDYRDDFDYVDSAQEALGNEIADESMRDALGMAKAALAAIPDVSCEAVADAFGLSQFQVRALSLGRHNRKQQKGFELSWYSREEIMGAICANNMGEMQ